MSDILLSKSNLGEGWIDLAPGEPYIIKDIFHKNYGSNFSFDLNNELSEYPFSAGLKSLTSKLEDIHQSPIIITNGAKQALSATFYSLNKFGYHRLFMQNPYWALLPQLIEKEGLKFVNKYFDSILCLAPNNPDGYTPSYGDLIEQSNQALEDGIPFIHDAAYYSHTYLDDNYKLGKIGDLQIFSVSKMLGLSGIRLGYIAVHNTKYYKSLQNYIEMMTVGVSTLSQHMFSSILETESNNPGLRSSFEKAGLNALRQNKLKLKLIKNPDLEIPNDIENCPGMFLWAKSKKSLFDKVKLNVISGTPFGNPLFIRMNLALRPEVLDGVIQRINSL